jgi:hypothetical protein
MAEEVIERIGLPVKCHTCKKRGFVKPRTDYGGWYKYKPIGRSIIWYCPGEAEQVKQWRQGFQDRYATPAPSQEAVAKASTEEELYKLLD